MTVSGRSAPGSTRPRSCSNSRRRSQALPFGGPTGGGRGDSSAALLAAASVGVPASSRSRSIGVRMCRPPFRKRCGQSESRSPGRASRPGAGSRPSSGEMTSSPTDGGTWPRHRPGSTRHGRVRPRSTRRDPRRRGPRRSAKSPRRRYREPARTRGVVLPPARPAAPARPAQGQARPSTCASQRHPLGPCVPRRRRFPVATRTGYSCRSRAASVGNGAPRARG